MSDQIRYVDTPQRIWSDTGRQKAAELIEAASGMSSDLPQLATLEARLTAQLVLAERPVTVTLRSDNACSVVVYKVARLGTFGEKQLTLKPGRYTAVGTRDGFRDVRKEFIVPAGQDPAPVTLTCEEPV